MLTVFDVHAPGVSDPQRLELYQPNLVGMSTNAFTIRGIERGGFVQEWYITAG